MREQVDGSPESMPKLREAIAAYERGLELNPTLSQGYHWLALAHQFIYLYPDPPRGWIEAYQAGVAPKIRLEATHISVLEFVSMEILREFACP